LLNEQRLAREVSPLEHCLLRQRMSLGQRRDYPFTPEREFVTIPAGGNMWS
jgi:hypothetical protein